MSFKRVLAVPKPLETCFGGPKSIKTERKRARKVRKGVRRRVKVFVVDMQAGMELLRK
jgi:hypothetical protein